MAIVGLDSTRLEYCRSSFFSKHERPGVFRGVRGCTDIARPEVQERDGDVYRSHFTVLIQVGATLGADVEAS